MEVGLTGDVYSVVAISVSIAGRTGSTTSLKNWNSLGRDRNGETWIKVVTHQTVMTTICQDRKKPRVTTVRALLRVNPVTAIKTTAMMALEEIETPDLDLDLARGPAQGPVPGRDLH